MTAPENHEPHGAHDSASHRRDYFKVFGILTVLTVLEIGVTYVPMPHAALYSLLVGFALAKAAYVGLYFMHLKYEKRALVWIAFSPLPIAAFYAVFLCLDNANLLRAATSAFTGGGGH